MRAKKTILKKLLTGQYCLFGFLGLLCLLGGLNDESIFSGVIGSAGTATAPALRIVGYVLISKRKTSPGQYDYTYADGDVTRIELDSLGNATAIVAPDGQRTVLTLDDNGFLIEATNSANESHSLAYTAHGLLTRSWADGL